jgi:hypothetical protein
MTTDSSRGSGRESAGMTPLLRLVVAVALTCAAAGCISSPMAPGSEQVRITRTPADVANCKAVGNLDRTVGDDAARNQAIGLGGDTVFDTTASGIFGTPALVRTGVIYRCAPR